MTEDQLYAKIGRQQVELENMHAQYNSLLNALEQVGSGAISPERVSVDLKARSWMIAPDGLKVVREDAGTQ